MSEFCLERNAFAVLDVGLRDNRAQIIEAHDDRLFEGGDEAVLGIARSRLTVPRDRIDEEVAFLPELNPNKAREVLHALPSVNSIEQALQLTQQVSNLSQLNLLADLLGRVDDKEELIGHYVQAHAHFDPGAAKECLEQARAGSGIGPITDIAWKSALGKLRDRHAGVLNDSIVRHPRGPAILTQLLEQVRKVALSSWQRGFLDEVVDRYDRWSQARLGEIDESLDDAIEAVRQNPGSSQPLTRVKQHLQEWDELSQPVQLRDESKGLDEPRSKKVFEKVRDLAIHLANEHEQYEAALELSRALEATFPELPSVAALVSKDIDALGSLIEQARESRVLGALAAIAKQAEDCLDALGRDIANGHFQSGGKGLAADLYRQFDEARAHSAQLTDAALPWKLVRSIAIDLNNDADQPESARILIAHIAASAPASIAPRLRDDLRALDNRVQTRAFEAALHDKDLNKAHQLVTGLINNASNEERQSLEKVRTAIAQQQAKRILKRVGWAVFAMIVLFSVISENNRSASTDYIPQDYGEASEDYLEGTSGVPGTGFGASETDLAPGVGDQSGEEAPPQGFYGTLSVPQLRYCLFEGERLSVMEREAPPSAYSMFNARVADFNSRCQGTSYTPADRIQIEQELLTSRADLYSEAREILAKFAPSVAEPVTEATASPSISDPSSADLNGGVSSADSVGENAQSYGSDAEVSE